MTYYLKVDSLFFKVEVECGKKEYYHILSEALNDAIDKIDALEDKKKQDSFKVIL